MSVQPSLWIVAALLIPGAGFADTPPVANATEINASPAKVEADGVRVHQIQTPYQPGETEVLVLLPDALEADRRYPVLFVLPVEAGRGERWGHGLDEVRKANLHNRYGLIGVMPTFAQLPWYADHPTDPLVRQEAYLLNAVLPFLRREYPQARHDRDGRLLVGFSKSGWGAWSLLLRHPDLFGKAAAWDAPLMLDAPGKYGSGPIFGTPENFAHHHVSRLVRDRQADLGPEPRLILLGHGNFRAETLHMHQLLQDVGMPHVFSADETRAHHWNSGWLPEAVQLLTDSTAK